jgi:hypothetical protein
MEYFIIQVVLEFVVRRKNSGGFPVLNKDQPIDTMPKCGETIEANRRSRAKPACDFFPLFRQTMQFVHGRSAIILDFSALFDLGSNDVAKAGAVSD